MLFLLEGHWLADIFDLFRFFVRFLSFLGAFFPSVGAMSLQVPAFLGGGVLLSPSGCVVSYLFCFSPLPAPLFCCKCVFSGFLFSPLPAPPSFFSFFSFSPVYFFIVFFCFPFLFSEKKRRAARAQVMS